jgi:hypothetical protein
VSGLGEQVDFAELTDGIPEGTVALCECCHHAIYVRRYKGSERHGIEELSWDYLAWTHYARRHFVGSHDPHPSILLRNKRLITEIRNGRA